MLRWCAYCQTSLGERAPFEDHSVTHTICAVCFDRVRRQRESDLGTQAGMEQRDHVVERAESLWKLGS